MRSTNILQLCVYLKFASIAASATHFSYDGLKGPQHWGENFPNCDGQQQSPIDIKPISQLAKLCKPFKFNNFNLEFKQAQITNNGHTALITKLSPKRPTISDGFLTRTYELAGIHFHWGENDSQGSEHTIGNKSFPMEMHMVFYQPHYGNLFAAANFTDGIVVMAFLFEISRKPNENFYPIIDALPYIVDPETTYRIENFPAMYKLIPLKKQRTFYTYLGSLTTPTCNPTVTWMVFFNKIPISSQQMSAFRQLKNHHGEFILHNFRPTQPLNNRLVRMII